MKLSGPVYIAGPMNGLPHKNIPLFNGVALTLRLLGLPVVNPADLDRENPDATYDWYLREALKKLLDCQTVVLLPGWQNSKGALIEKNLADSLGMEVYEWREVTSQLAVGNSSGGETMGSAAAADISEGTSTTDGDGASVTSIDTARATSSRSAGPATRGRTEARQKPSARD